MNERGVDLGVADERVEVFPPTRLHWLHNVTTTTVTIETVLTAQRAQNLRQGV